MDSVIIGTAGHVDHGKTALINALTGIDTDRLKEEKERGISINLGFASFSMSDGRVAGIIDVPGHERFINNMLAGAVGIDLVLLVIDATEGVMAQTREHLSILELLGLQQGIVALTKTDLVDEEWCDLVEEETREELKGTFLEDVPYCRVSSATGQGLDELKEKLEELTRSAYQRDVHAPLRLPADRSFTISGFGTIVTGTLVQGKVSTGDTVEVLPAGENARVRNLQVFSSSVDEAWAGQRVAINLSGLEKSNVERGSVVCRPGFFKLTSLIDASVNVLSHVPRGIKTLDPVHLYVGTTRVVARVALLDKEALMPGESGLAQLRLESPLVAERKDKFIIRSYSPVTTIGGGVVLDPVSERRPRRIRKKVVQSLKELEQEIKVSGSDKSFVLQKLGQLKIADISRLETATRLGTEKLKSIIKDFAEEEKVIDLDGSYVTAENMQSWEDIIITALDAYHLKHTLLAGIPRAQLKGSIPADLSIREYDSLLENLSDRGLIEDGDRIARAGFYPRPTPQQEELINKIEKTFLEYRFQPPALKELSTVLKQDVPYIESLLDYMINSERMVKISEEIYLHRSLYNEALRVLKDHFAKHDTITMAEFRDYLQSSRKYMQALLEHFDQKKITRRKDDYRVPWKMP